MNLSNKNLNFLTKDLSNMNFYTLNSILNKNLCTFSPKNTFEIEYFDKIGYTFKTSI
jgi:hypothetical protein